MVRGRYCDGLGEAYGCEMQSESDENSHKATAGKRTVSGYRWGLEGPQRRTVQRVRRLFALERAAAFNCSISEN